MDLNISTPTLSKYLNIVNRVVGAKANISSLNNVLITAKDQNLTLIGTDLETQIVANTKLKKAVSAKESFAVNANIFTQYISTLPQDSELKISTTATKLKVSTNNSSAEFSLSSADDFPILTPKQPTKVVTVDALTFSDMIDKTTFACAKDNSKPILTGVNIEIDTKTITMVSIDGIRLSKISRPIKKPSINTPSFVISYITLDHLNKIIATEFGSESGNKDDKDAKSKKTSADTTVEIQKTKDNNFIIFKYDNIEVYSRLLDGQFPEYKQIIPTAHQTQAEVEKATWLNSLKRVGVFALSAISQKVLVDVSKKEITMESSLAEIGQTKDAIKAKIDGEPIKIAFQSRYLNDILNHIDSDQIIFETTNDDSPGVFKPKNDKDFIHLIMPLKLDE